MCHSDRSENDEDSSLEADQRQENDDYSPSERECKLTETVLYQIGAHGKI